MEIKGKIIWAGELRSGVNATSGKQWSSQDFAIENITTDNFGREIHTVIAFNVFGGDKIRDWHPTVGDIAVVGYSISARKFNDRWINDVRAWKYDRVGNGQQTADNGQQTVAPSLYAQAQQAVAASQAQVKDNGQQTTDNGQQAMQNLQQTFNTQTVGEGNGLPF